ncbi:hypothetical protein PR048_024336 [Dryococelus australis]|uniref:Uncharacterized protein n=1 Tax=Dryococelus australis TaxID=614101 RepID=A0ABQ9GND8_9NEOP|nr:hypothetical protein PR048_024336 [Dryococelus australis]
MGRNTISIQQRDREYKNEQFYQKWKKKDILEKHMKSDSHQATKKIFLSKTDEKKNAVRRQALVPSVFEMQNKTKTFKKMFIQDTVQMCLQSNIPIYKLDHRAVREYFANTEIRTIFFKSFLQVCVRFRKLAFWKCTLNRVCTSLWG